MSLLQWVTVGLQLVGVLVLIRLGVNISRYYKKTEGTFASQQLMVTALLTRVYMLERIVEQAGLVKFGAEDGEKLLREDAG